MLTSSSKTGVGQVGQSSPTIYLSISGSIYRSTPKGSIQGKLAAALVSTSIIKPCKTGVNITATRLPASKRDVCGHSR